MRGELSLYGMASGWDVLDWARAKNVTPLFLCVTGSHLWHLNRPDSDLDIRGIYLDPLEKVLSLHTGRNTIEALGILGDCDIQMYEFGKVLKMLNDHNGNLVEMLLSPTAFYSALGYPSYDYSWWHDLASKYITKKLANYYRGYHVAPECCPPSGGR